MTVNTALTPTSAAGPDTHRGRAAATALGRRAGDELTDATTLVAQLRVGLHAFADPEYQDGQRRIAPGIGPVIGVRRPLLDAVTSGLRAATRRDSSSTVLDLAEAMLRAPEPELHWLAIDLLHRTIATDPERSWQIVRAISRAACEWITVDSLAHVAAAGIVREPYRWAELEQLVYSPSRWERRLAGSTVATLPFEDRVLGRTPDVVRRGLDIVADLIGDPEPDVQKALAWGLRNLHAVDAAAVEAFVRREATTAAATDDGHRARVVRDTFEKLPAALVTELRSGLDGVRRHPIQPGTSRAAATAAAFTGLGVDVVPAERPVVPRT